MNNNLTMNCKRQDNTIITELTGDLDISSSPKFTEKIEKEFDEKNANLVFDMGNLNYIDSTGLGSFITLYRKVKDTDFTIDLINVKPSIKKIFTITELDKVFRID